LKKLSTEFFVGLFMVVGFVCFAIVAVRFGGEAFWSVQGYHLTATFQSVSGLKKSAPVEIAGVPVGKVQSIILKNNKALVTMLINSGVIIEDDTIASIRTKGLIGEKYLRLSPGASGEVLKDGDELIETEPVVDIEDLIGKFIYGK
jgi:phospholipid/cholesterol/gamma-HCH transport system substrate-binding protein